MDYDDDDWMTAGKRYAPMLKLAKLRNVGCWRLEQ